LVSERLAYRKHPPDPFFRPGSTDPLTRHRHRQARHRHRRTDGVTDLQTESYTEGEASEGSSSRMSEKKSTAQHVTVHRIYDEAQKSDGTRILVDRVWPRGVSKDKAELDDRIKAVAPSSELRKWYSHDPEKYEEFSRRYSKELQDDNHADALDKWFKAVAPSSELRKWYSHDPEKFDEFSRRYRKELEDDDAAEALDELRDYAKKGTLTLLTASKRDDISQATVLAEILNGSDT